jgi:hypothetical protein
MNTHWYSGVACTAAHSPTGECELRFPLTAHGAGILLALALLLSADTSARAAVIFVSTNGNDILSGTSWTDAKRTVAGAIDASAANDEVWVARGMYAEHITLKPDIALYGGFSGTEVERDARNWSANHSVLWGMTNKVVVSVTNSGPATRLDGFIIGGGNGIHGGGIRMAGSGPVIANNSIRNNITDGAGSGISIWGFHLVSSTEAYFPMITNNVIVENQSINDEGDGAGIAVVGSSPVIAWNVIARNTATRNGGAIACWRHSLPLIANNLITANSASYDELTASLGGGGIFASATDLDGRPISGAISAPVILNNVIAANGGRHGGGITIADSTLGAATIANNTVVANNGAGIYWGNTWPTNINNIVAFNSRGFERSTGFASSAEIMFNDVFGNEVLGVPADYVRTADRTGIDGNISADPRFANRVIGDFHLQPDSPCVNAGSTAAPSSQLDIDGQLRIFGSAVDMGADESTGTTWDVPTPIMRVSKNGDGTDGLTWATAKTTVADGIAEASKTGGEVWVAAGTYPEHIAPPAFVYLFGGFQGHETDRAARNAPEHPAILDGGGVPPVVYYRNAGYRVSALDGFMVRNGGAYTGGNPFHNDLTNRFGGRGGGIYCRVSAPDITGNLVCSNSIGSPFNSFEALGGGIYCYLAPARIVGNDFSDNEVLKQMTGNGGGVYCQESMATIDGNTFTRNHALDGAAIFGSYSELRVARNIVRSNALYNISPLPTYMGSGYGALMFWLCPEVLIEGNTIQGNVADVGAGICLDSCNSAHIFNNVIRDNLAYDFSGFGQGGMGGGLYCMVNLASTNIVIANNTFVGNDAPATFMGAQGGALALTLLTNTLVFANNIVASNSSGIWRDWRTSIQPVLRDNCINNTNGNYDNLSAGVGDIQADPLFVNRVTGDFRLQSASPCIDAGKPVNGTVADFDGVHRPLDGNADGVAAFDIGAFEFIHPHADTDADTCLDAAEVIAGTNPTDKASVLRASLQFLTEENCLSVRWPSVIGRTYGIESLVDLGAMGSWNTAVSNLSGTGTIVEWRDHNLNAAARTYRLTVRKE